MDGVSFITVQAIHMGWSRTSTARLNSILQEAIISMNIDGWMRQIVFRSFTSILMPFLVFVTKSYLDSLRKSERHRRIAASADFYVHNDINMILLESTAWIYGGSWSVSSMPPIITLSKPDSLQWIRVLQ
ncbi:hypothetical protein SISSUDRAFT_433604 [Sistotremastrum suecicum HHB10207 ss-3]|uniref:Uncharacterized protein n=1 Tax=Sistotremastrum suecicum HHB10207 ss-3 TaxID=1314776 RepID=A0A165YGQ2_9AGAM|nr:hypothetical protein SISSUDRAFT_433604 [Sistotremastrum suecicum HHB10207 ss-3]